MPLQVVVWHRPSGSQNWLEQSLGWVHVEQMAPELEDEDPDDDEELLVVPEVLDALAVALEDAVLAAALVEPELATADEPELDDEDELEEELDDALEEEVDDALEVEVAELRFRVEPDEAALAVDVE